MSLFQILNQNSFVVISGTLLVIVAIGLVKRRARHGWIMWGALVVVAAIGWYVFRTTDSLQLNTVADYEAALRSGQPTLIEFYSNY
jgi:hypothetical protein